MLTKSITLLRIQLVILCVMLIASIYLFIQSFIECNRLESLPDKIQTFTYPNPIMDTDLMNMARAGYLMGIERKGNDKWKEDSALLRNYIFKPLKTTSNAYSKID